jgi:hypothetical protein
VQFRKLVLFDADSATSIAGESSWRAALAGLDRLSKIML